MPGPAGTWPKGTLSPMSGHSRALGPVARVGSIAPRLPIFGLIASAMQQATDIGNHPPVA